MWQDVLLDIWDTYGLYIIILIGIIIYNLVRFRKKKMLEQQEVGIPKKDVGFQTTFLDKGMEKANLIETSPLQHLRKIRMLIAEDLREKQEMYDKAKLKYDELVSMEKLLRENILVREEELKMYDVKIREVENG